MKHKERNKEILRVNDYGGEERVCAMKIFADRNLT
jgi:hypothetical protein